MESPCLGTLNLMLPMTSSRACTFKLSIACQNGIFSGVFDGGVVWTGGGGGGVDVVPGIWLSTN